MGVQLKQVADGGLGLAGTTDGGDGGFLVVPFPYTAAAVSQTIFTADRNYIIKGIRGRVDVAGTGGAATLQVRKVASGTAIASGTLVHTGTYNFVGTVNTQQTLTLSSTANDLLIPAGTSVCFNPTGVLTSAVGTINLILAPA